MNRPCHDVPGKLCGCCEGLEKLTPMVIANRPGLDALAYRVGTHVTFLETMKACLSSSDYPALVGLTTRESTDPSIALLDAWATVADVLTFYQERIANEGYLLTATERRSILELARLVGYKLRPGVSASVYLAFTLEKDAEVEIPADPPTRAQSLPGPGELPQSFETSDPLKARAEWNQIKPRLTRPQQITFEDPSGANNADLPETGARKISTLYFQGTATSLKPNDPLLFIFKPKGEETGEQEQDTVFRRIEAVEPQAAENRTKVTLQPIRAIGRDRAYQVTAADVEDIRQIATKYRNLELFDVSAESAMTKSVLSALQQLESSLTEGVPIAEATAALDEALQNLRREHERAEARKYQNLEPWVGGLVSDLENVVARLSTATTTAGTTYTPGAPGYPGDSAQLSAQAILSPAVGFADLLDPLVRPPSKQPANALQLERTVAQAFASKADVAPRILTIFKPQLKSTLYRAWADAEVTLPSELESAEALRVKAAPFGHNAPLKPIYDDERAIVGQEEWPLAQAGRIDLRLFSSPSEFAPGVQVLVSTMFGGQIHKKRMRLAPSTFLLGDLVGRIAEGDEDSIIVFSFRDVKSRTVVREITLTEAETGLIIAFDDPSVDKKEVSVTWGEVVQTIVAEHRVTVATRADAGDAVLTGELLTIRDEFPPAKRDVLTLDAEYDQIMPESWVVIQRADEEDPRIFQVADVKTVSMAAYGISRKATQLTLKLGDQNGEWLKPTDWTAAVLRGVRVYAQNEALQLAKEPKTDDVKADTIELDDLYEGLESGRWLIVSGERTDIPGVTGVAASELVMLAGVEQDFDATLPGDTIHSTLILANSLAYTYKRDTVTIHGNVVKATHGETREEVLGSGDGSKALQQFALKQSPLTYRAAPTPAGAESTLEVRVDDVLWHEKDRLVGLGPKDRAYITRTDDEDKTTIIFGDGQHGARLPTGVENVEAVYRTGIGRPGNVAAGQISLLATRPLGVKGVINPLRASGGTDRESRDQARRNAPLAVMALDRLVSVQDYADFARTFAGIGKVSAVELPDGRREVVHLTIAGADDVPIEPTSDLYRNLRRALHQFGDLYQPLQIDVRQLKLLVISAKVRLLPDYAWEFVAPEIRATLLDTFSFQRRELGQDVVRGEVISAIQHVPGVAYVDLDILDGVREDITPEELECLADTLMSEDQPKRRVAANMARINRGATSPDERIKPAQIAYLSPDVPDTLILTAL